MTRYNFTETTDFLNNSVPLGDLYADVVEAMHNISEYRHLTRKNINQVWDTLFFCAELLDTIQIKRKKKGGTT